MPKTKRLGVDLPYELCCRFRHCALEDGKTMSKQVEEWVQFYVATHRSSSTDRDVASDILRRGPGGGRPPTPLGLFARIYRWFCNRTFTDVV